MNNRQTIVEKFKQYARDLGKLYKKRKELDEMIAEYETELRGLGKVLEFADSAELAYRSAETPAN